MIYRLNFALSFLDQNNAVSIHRLHTNRLYIITNDQLYANKLPIYD